MYDSVSYSFLTNFGENIIKSDAVWTVSVPFGVVTVSVLLYSALADFYSLLLKSWNLQRCKEVHDGRQTRMSLNKSRSYLLYSLICICMLPEKSTKMIMLCHFCLLLCVLSCFCIVSCSVFPPEFLHTCSASPSSAPSLHSWAPSPHLCFNTFLHLHPFPTSVKFVFKSALLSM